MATLTQIRIQRRALSVQSDLLRVRLRNQFDHLRPTALWIEQGYHLAQALSQDRRDQSWISRLIGLLKL